ncbi:hypothetical protein PAMP_014845 [Pampus punctatissimus]
MSPHESFSSMMESKPKYIGAITMLCRKQSWSDIWKAADVFILISGVMANAALLWLFLRERKSLSASKVLGVNLVVMDLIYLSIMPISLFYDADKQVNNMHQAREIFSMFNLIGCPLLLACMCVERYLAVIRPVLYMRVRKWEYRVAVSAVVWAITLSFCLATGIVDDMTIIMVPVSIIISCLFLLMLTCLGGVLWSLRQESPARTTHGTQGRSESPLKRRAVENVLFVVVPAVMSYLPVLVMVPMVLYMVYWADRLTVDQELCNIFKLSVLFPSLGVFIGPLFYLSKVRQMCCRRDNA